MIPLLQSLKFRLFTLGVILTLIGVGLRLVVFLPILRQQVYDLVAVQQQMIAEYVARDISRSVDSHREVIDTLAASFPPTLLKQPEQIHLWLKERQLLNPRFNGGLLIVSPDGSALLSAYPSQNGRSTLDYSVTDWFRKAQQSTRTVAGGPVREGSHDDARLTLARAIRDDDGTILAVIAGVTILNERGFLAHFGDTKFGSKGSFLLVSPEDNVFLAASDSSMVFRSLPALGLNPMHDRAMSGYRGTDETVSSKGIKELSTVTSVAGTGWYLVTRLPSEEAFKPVITLRESLYYQSALTLAVVSLLLFLMIANILKPLTAATRDMSLMAKDRKELEPLPVIRHDEVGALISSFNLLVARLQAKDAELRASEQQMTFLAHHDPLTSLPNRAMFDDRFEQALVRAEREGTQVALLFCDLDGFKAINDCYGHATGDRVLKHVAEQLMLGRRRADTVARLGGDEFVILISDVADARTSSEIVARHCLAAITSSFDVGGVTLQVGISIGIALYTGGRSRHSTLLSQADAAMYAAKQSGKGTIVYADSIAGEPILAPMKPNESAPP